MKIDTRVLCTTDDDKLGIDGEDIWLDCRIDLTHVVAIKRNGKGENENKAVLYYVHGDYFVIDLDYDDALKLFPI